MTDRAAAIRTESDALAFIAAQVESGKIAQPRIENGKVLHARKCRRCSGTGLYIGPTSAGVCFDCGAKPARMQWQEWVPVKQWAQDLRGKLRRKAIKDERIAAARASRETSQRETNAARGLGELTNREVFEAQRASIPADRAARLALREHVGTPGEAIELEVTLVQVFDTVSKYGPLFVHRFVDAAGNVLVWMHAKGLELELRTRLVLRATVKEHSTWRGEAQTLVKGAKVVRELGLEVSDAEQLAVACDLAEGLGLNSYAFADRILLTNGMADEQTLHRLHDHPATRRALQLIAASGRLAA